MSVSTTAGLDLGPATDASDPLESANDGVPLFQTQRGPGIPGIRIHGCGRCTSDAIFVGNMPGAPGPERQVPLAVAIGGGKPGVRGLLVCATKPEARSRILGSSVGQMHHGRGLAEITPSTRAGNDQQKSFAALLHCTRG